MRCPSSQVGPWPATGAGLRAVAFSCDLLQLFEEHYWTGWALSLRSFVAFCGHQKNNTLLVGGFKYFLFSPLLGEMIQIWLYNIFQMGWNHHQPEKHLASGSIRSPPPYGPYHLWRDTPPKTEVWLTAFLVVLNLLDEMEELGHYSGNWKVVSWFRHGEKYGCVRKSWVKTPNHPICS